MRLWNLAVVLAEHVQSARRLHAPGAFHWKVAAAAVAYWAFALAAATTYVRFERKLPAYHLGQIPYDAAVVLLGAAHALLIRAALERVMGRPLVVQAVAALVCTLAAATPFEWIMRAMARAFFPWVGNIEPPPFTVAIVAKAIVFWGAIFGLWAAANLAAMHAAEARRRERRLAAAQLQAQQAQLLALRYQVNPHFLFNTLNTISALILDGRNAVADEMVMRLSDFFHATLDEGSLHDTPLSQEIELQRLYLEIEQVRFEDQLQVEIDMPAGLEGALVPSLILQPLVENAVKHGLRGPGRVMRLRIDAWAEGERLIVAVDDDGRGPGPRSEDGGVGLRNVRSRLETRFPDAATFEAGARDGGGFRVRLGLPLRFA